MGKVKASTVHRQQRLKDFKNGLVIRRNAKGKINRAIALVLLDHYY